MSSNSSWVPDEDPQTLFSERCWLQGVIVSTTVYGITVALYFLSLHLLVRNKNRFEWRLRLPLMIYISLIFLLSTLFMISLAAFTQMAFIDNRNYPGGPNAYENNEFSVPIDNVGNVMFTLSNWLCDALVVWRFKIIYQRCRFPWWSVMLFPFLMLAGSVALGIMFLIQVSTTNPYVTNGINFTLPYLSLSLALNIILTIAIVFRLMNFRYQAGAVLGPGFGAHYTSVAAMVIESAAIYSAVSIAFLVLFAIGNAVSQVFLQSLSQFQAVASLLIIFRVAQGKAWGDDTALHVMAGRGRSVGEMRFASTIGPSITLASSGEALKSTDKGINISNTIAIGYDV